MNLNKKIFIGLLLIGFIGLALLINLRTSANNPSSTIIIGNQLNSEFKIEIADTQKARQQGLMNRTSLASTNGMLFNFDDNKNHSFWMKNTLIPLDIIFINNQKIVKIHSNVPPCEADPCPMYASEQPTNQVLEINASLANKYQIQVGQKISIKK